jgi:hypothetical protein
MIKNIAIGLSIASLIYVVQVPSAESLTWYLANANFDDGGTASGFFDYDATIGFDGTYSNVSITTTTGTLLPGNTFTDADLSSSNSSILDLIKSDGSSVQLLFNNLTNAGGTETVNVFENGPGPGFILREADPTTVTTIPIPFEFESTLGLIMLSGLFGVHTFLKKRKAKKLPAKT